MNIIISRFNNCGFHSFKFAAMYSTQTHFGFQNIDETEKSKKGI